MFLGSLSSGRAGDVLGRQFLVFFKDAVNGEFGADDFAEIAIDALSLLDDLGRVVTLPVEFRPLFQHPVGAELDTEAAALAAVLDNVQFPDGNGMGGRIQGESPKFHRLLLYASEKIYYLL
jgi:hypothetical protein